eukprot:3753155-Rhodomonas_salina.1
MRHPSLGLLRHRPQYRLPTDHPLVQLDKTNANRALEGAFLGWHDTTPTFWMYSFRLQKVVRMCYAVFSKNKMPFRYPTVLVNSGDLTDLMVVVMHEADGQHLFAKDGAAHVLDGVVQVQVQASDKDKLSQRMTQQLFKATGTGERTRQPSGELPASPSGEFPATA